MIISTIIHGLEIATVLLVGLMSFQITRCYRQYATDAGSSSVLKPVDVKQTDVRENDTEITIAESNSTLREVPQPLVEKTPASSAALNDYIGGFFAAEPETDLNAFKAEVEAPIEQEKLSDSTVTVSKEQLAEFKAPETIEPILINPVRVVDLDEEDTFIVVEAGSVEAADKKENVMSDKVVHAMLEEANLVYTP